MSGAVLLPAFLVAVGLYALSSRPGERIAYLSRFMPTVVVLAAALALPLLADLVGRGGVRWFGQRSGTLQYVHLGPFLRLLLYQTGDLILYAAVLPALAAAVMVGIGLSRRAAEPERLYAAVALPTVLESTSAGDGSFRFEDAYEMSGVQLEVRAPGYEDRRIVLDGPAVVDVVLYERASSARLLGTLCDASGAPIEGRVASVGRLVETDAAGRFALDLTGLAAGETIWGFVPGRMPAQLAP